MATTQVNDIEIAYDLEGAGENMVLLHGGQTDRNAAVGVARDGRRCRQVGVLQGVGDREHVAGKDLERAVGTVVEARQSAGAVANGEKAGARGGRARCHQANAVVPGVEAIRSLAAIDPGLVGEVVEQQGVAGRERERARGEANTLSRHQVTSMPMPAKSGATCGVSAILLTSVLAVDGRPLSRKV